MSLLDRWDAELAALKAQGRYRALRAPAGIDFSSNDYLGYAGSRTATRGRGVDSPDIHSGTASRLLRGHHPLWDEVETALARWHGAEAVLLFNSGYVANEGLLATLIAAHDWVASDDGNHASIIDGLRLAKAERFVFRHQDLNYLEDGLRQAARNRPPDRELFVVTEALFGMDGDRTPLKLLVELTERYGAHVIVDEAHSTGCFGPAGSGCVDEAGLRARVLASVHTGGKALGVLGAYVCGSAALRELLINRCRHLIFTTALPLAVAPWWLAALARIRQDDEGRQLLHANAAFFRQQLASLGLPAGGAHYIVPLILGADGLAVEMAERVQHAGFDVRAIRPPTVAPGTARLRISLHADHERPTLLALANALRP